MHVTRYVSQGFLWSDLLSFFLPLCEWKNYIVFSIEIVKWRKILEWRKILNIFHYDFKHHYDIVMQNIIILMAWLTCSKPLKFHVPSLQNITAAKLILISRWGVDWNSMFGQQLLYSILKINVKIMQDLKENSSVQL